MKKYLLPLSFIGLTLFAYSCQKKSATTPASGSTVYLDLPDTITAYYKDQLSGGFIADNNLATLGRVLFYDAHLSINNSVSCGSCHKQELAFADNVALSRGFQGVLTKRNTPAIQNIGNNIESFEAQFETNQNNSVLFWDGRENNLINMMTRPISNHVEMGMEDLSVLPQKIAGLSYYGKLFAQAFGDSAVTSARISQALAAFSAAISSQKSRFDQYQAGNRTVLTAQEMEGMNLFVSKYNCATCHTVNVGNYTSESASFKDIGLNQNYTDLGRGAITGISTDNGTFKVPSLRNVGLTAPYMHDGRFATLSDVIDHYSHGIVASSNLDTALQRNRQPMQMNISDNEKQALIAFLNTLTDYNVTIDPRFSNPFKVK